MTGNAGEYIDSVARMGMENAAAAAAVDVCVSVRLSIHAVRSLDTHSNF